jgi:hypothetical protein
LTVKAYDKALRAANRASCDDVDCVISSARLHWVLSKDVSYQVGALRLPLIDIISSKKEVAEHLPMAHFDWRGP